MRKLIHNKPAFLLLCLLMGVISSLLWANITDWNVHGRPNADWFSGSNTPRDVPMQWIREMDTLLGSGLGIARGTAYYVDGANGSTTGSRLSWNQALSTVAAAVALSNTNMDISGNPYNMNRIYINGGTYTESLTTFPNACHVIGVGSKVRLQGVQNTGGNGDNSRWWNIQFRNNSSAPIITVNAGDHGFELHGCRLEDQGACTMAIDLGNAQDIIIEGCELGMGSPPPIGMQISGATMKGLDIYNNKIYAITTGINITTAVAATYQAYIRDNYIEKGDPGGLSDQLDYGIKFMKTNGAQGIFVVNNYISAADALYFAYTASGQDEWCALNNYIVEGTSGDTQTDMSD